MEQEQAALDEQDMMREQQDMQRSLNQAMSPEQRQALQQEGIRELREPQGEMPEDPTQAGPAQERLQGGPSAQDIRQREFAENAPQ